MCIVALIKTLVKDTVGIQVQILAVEPCTINRNQLFLSEMNRQEIRLALGNRLTSFLLTSYSFDIFHSHGPGNSIKGDFWLVAGQFH